ncbi:unnamed protein product [Blepharisma stoltei]|uniref:Uncharacterized protein n=1 Tax=Blepharisma stoltei TaxID=1481888 RepID=A0AAU9K3H5_9CILI|nr:unnamed protein product [Blepharisma stoltei]
MKGLQCAHIQTYLIRFKLQHWIYLGTFLSKNLLLKNQEVDSYYKSKSELIKKKKYMAPIITQKYEKMIGI